MRFRDYGISLDGYHNKVLTHAESAFLNVIFLDHYGADNKISGKELAGAWMLSLDGEVLFSPALQGRWMRWVRLMQNHLLFDHEIQVYSETGNQGGYWYGETEEEAEKFYDTFRRRGLTGLKKAARGRQSVLVGMMKQISFEFDDLDDRTATVTPSLKPRVNPTPVAVVDAFLEKMMGEPERFADDLRKIGSKFGSVLLPKAVVNRALTTAQELQEILAGLQS